MTLKCSKFWKIKKKHIRNNYMVCRRRGKNKNYVTKCVGVCLRFNHTQERRGTWIYGVVKMFPLIHPDLSKASVVVVDYMWCATRERVRSRLAKNMTNMWARRYFQRATTHPNLWAIISIDVIERKCLGHVKYNY